MLRANLRMLVALALTPLLALQAGAAEYPAGLAEAQAARTAVQAEVDRLRESAQAAPELVRAAEQLLALHGEIAELHRRRASMAELTAGRAERQRLARAEIEGERQPRPSRGRPPDLSRARSAAAEAARVSGALRSRLRTLDDEASTWLAEERSAALTRLSDHRDRLDTLRAEGRPAAASAEGQRTLQLQLEAAELASEHAARWLAFLDDRGAFLRDELPLVDLEIEAAAETERRLFAQLERATEDHIARLERDRDEAEEQARTAQLEITAAATSGEQMYRKELAETAALTASIAARRLELDRLGAQASLNDVLTRARERFTSAKRRDQRLRSIDADTEALVRRELARVDALRAAHLVGEERQLRIGRQDVLRELMTVEQRLSELDELWSERATVALAGDGDELKAAWEAAKRQRRAVLSGLAALLRQLAETHVGRLEARAELRQLLAEEQRWLDRRSLLMRTRDRSVAAALGQARNDLKAWLERVNAVRVTIAVLALALIVVCGLLTFRLRRRSAVVPTDTGEASAFRARRAWREVLQRAYGAGLALLFAVLLPGLLAVGRSQEIALQAAFLWAAFLLGLYAIAVGMLRSATPSAAIRSLTRVATTATLLLLTIGVPLRFLTALHYGAVNPDLLEIGGLMLRTALATLAVLVLLQWRRLGELLSEPRREQLMLSLHWPRFALLAVLGVVIVSDWLGWASFATWLLQASLGSTVFLALGFAAAHNLRRALVDQPEDDDESDTLEAKRRHFIAVELRLVGRLVILAAVLWGIGASLGVERTELVAWKAAAVWSVGGDGTGLTLGGVVDAALVLAFTFVAAQAVRGLLELYLLVWLGLDHSARYSLATVFNYLTIAIGFLLTLSALGLRLNDVQWLLAAAGVGIGFGLQEIISNLVSGLIILFERPIKVGDQVELDNTIGTVIAVTMRSTSVQTFQNHILIVPNKDIITGKVVNRTGADPRVRLELAIGVAYGSDLKLVREVLLEVTRNDRRVMRRPPPNVLFMGHGQSSLDFELRAWTHIDVRQQVLSDLRLALDAAFRRKGIEIPFPQRDVHIIDSAESAPLPAAQPRSVDGVAASDGTSGVQTDGAPGPSPK